MNGNQTRDPDPDSALSWAAGCGCCSCGVVGLDCTHAPAPLFVVWAVLFQHGGIDFCGCRAGQMARRYAQRTSSNLAAVDRIAGGMVAEIIMWAAGQGVAIGVPSVRFVAADGREVEFITVEGAGR